jgi:hypothetical protein
MGLLADYLANNNIVLWVAVFFIVTLIIITNGR